MKGTFGRLFEYAKPYHKRIWRASILSVLNKIADLAPPALIGIAVDIVVKKEQSLLAQWGIVDPFEQLIWLAALTVIIWVLESIFEYAFQWDWRNLAQEIQHELRLKTYSHVQRLDIGWFRDRKSGRLMSIINDDVNQLERFLNGGANDILQVTTTAICVSGVFFYFSPSIAILSMLPIPLILWGSFWFQHKIAPRYAEVREQASQVNSQLANNLAGIETVKSFTGEDREVLAVDRLSAKYKKANASAIQLSSAFSPLIRMAIVVGFVATLIYGGKLTLAGEMEIGVYSVLIFLTQRLLWPLTRLGATFDLYQRAMASSDRILDLLDTRSSIVDGREQAVDVRGDILLENIQFSYPERENVLEGFSLSIPYGQTIAIVGPTGSGKSTLVRLMLRFYDPQEGCVRLDGKDVRNLTLESLRSSIGLVSQGVYLFDGTILENILYGRPNANKEDVIEAAKASEVHSFISSLPNGYDTRIGERGLKLSGGQRQRISIARAVLKDPPILILDEATSAVDNETEAAIQRSLERVSEGRTTVVIAHRLSTIRNADQIVVMESGKIIAQGSHGELVQTDGLYTRLWKVQTGLSL